MTLAHVKHTLTMALIVGLFLVPDQRLTGQGRNTPIVFGDVNVIDGTGSAVMRRQTVVVIGDRITAVGDVGRAAVPSGAHVVNAAGKYLMPGLWDLHVHTRYAGIDHLRLFTANGVSGIRDMGGPWEHLEVLKRWRQEIARGTRIGPRIIAAGPLLDGPGSLFSHSEVVKNTLEARRAVAHLRRAGAAFVKLYELLSRDSFYAIVDEAKRQGLPTAGHLPFVLGLGEISEAGLKTVEHADPFVLASSAREHEILGRLRSVPPTEARSILLTSRTEIVDTLDLAKVKSIAAVLRRNNTSL